MIGHRGIFTRNLRRIDHPIVPDIPTGAVLMPNIGKIIGPDTALPVMAVDANIMLLIVMRQLMGFFRIRPYLQDLMKVPGDVATISHLHEPSDFFGIR